MFALYVQNCGACGGHGVAVVCIKLFIDQDPAVQDGQHIVRALQEANDYYHHDTSFPPPLAGPTSALPLLPTYILV